MTNVIIKIVNSSYFSKTSSISEPKNDAL